MMPSLRGLLTLSPLVLLALAACSAAGASDDASTGSEQDLSAHARPPRLPAPGGSGELAPWGGADAAHWRPEATLANATSDALNRAWALPNVTDAVVAVPVKMYSSPYSEFGDGQLNAIPSFAGWKTTERPPVVATLIDFSNAPRKAMLRFDRTLALTATTIEIVYYANGRKLVEVPITQTPAGDFEAEWLVPNEVGFGLVSNAAVAIHPKGWGDWFPMWFRMPVKQIRDMRASTVTFSDGKSITDREGISVQGQQGVTQTPYERLAAHQFSAKYNNQQSGTVVPFNPTDIHARFPFNGGMVTTGVGQGWTWVADERPGGFKVMYTCFEGRRPDLEASAPQGGVASGGGWHYIGDPAETILNDLEAGPLVVGAAMTNPFGAGGLPSGGFAYNLTDVVTVRWLYPGEAFVTPRGGAVSDGHGGTITQDNYHWYYFQGPKNVCTEELVNTGAVPTGFEP